MSRLPKLKVFADPVGLHSRAMIRVANAIRRHAPPHVVFVNSPEESDLQFLHVIGWEDGFAAWPRPYVAIQYCLGTAGGHPINWRNFWFGSVATWSYYDLPAFVRNYDCAVLTPQKYFIAPLGADGTFRRHAEELLGLPGNVDLFGVPRRDLIVTSGYVTGPGAEAIEEVWTAAERTGWSGVHIGPSRVEGMTRKSLPAGWQSVEGCSDEELASYYRRAYFVSGLRYSEGFELPAVEGLLCGAIPLLFDQPSHRLWYGNLGVEFVPEPSYFDPLGYYRVAWARTLTTLLETRFALAAQRMKSERATSDIALLGADSQVRALTRFNWANIIPDLFKVIDHETNHSR